MEAEVQRAASVTSGPEHSKLYRQVPFKLDPCVTTFRYTVQQNKEQFELYREDKCIYKQMKFKTLSNRCLRNCRGNWKHLL